MNDDTIKSHVVRLGETWTGGKGWPDQTVRHWVSLFERENPAIFKRAVDDLLREHKSTRLIPSAMHEYLDRHRRKFEIGKGATHCQRCGEPVPLSAKGYEEHEAVCRKLPKEIVREKWYDRNPKFRQ